MYFRRAGRSCCLRSHASGSAQGDQNATRSQEWTFRRETEYLRWAAPLLLFPPCPDSLHTKDKSERYPLPGQGGEPFWLSRGSVPFLIKNTRIKNIVSRCQSPIGFYELVYASDHQVCHMLSRSTSFPSYPPLSAHDQWGIQRNFCCQVFGNQACL